MKRRKVIRLLLGALAILAADTLIIERYWIKFPETEFLSEKIPVEFDGLRIAVFSDLHYGFLNPPAWIEWVIDQTNKQNVDIILGLGDYVKKRNADHELEAVWPLLMKLKAKTGVFMVNGNHDHWANNEKSLELLEHSGLSIRHRHTVLQRNSAKIVLAGTGDYWEDEVGIEKALKGAPSQVLTIVATHNPDAINIEREVRADLFIAGHTHGGQVRIPFFDYAPVVPIKNKALDKGWQESRYHEPVFISAGIGWSILPLRFYCRAEIPIIVLRRKR